MCVVFFFFSSLHSSLAQTDASQLLLAVNTYAPNSFVMKCSHISYFSDHLVL